MRKLLGAIASVIAITAACSGDSSPSIESFCTKAADAQSIFVQLGDTPSDSSRGIALFEELTKNAPGDIKDDMTTILRFLKSSTTSDAPSDSSVTTASAKVVQFFKDKCHVDLNASGGSGANTSSKFSSVASSLPN